MKKGEIRKEGFQSININHWNNSSCSPPPLLLDADSSCEYSPHGFLFDRPPLSCLSTLLSFFHSSQSRHGFCTSSHTRFQPSFIIFGWIGFFVPIYNVIEKRKKKHGSYLDTDILITSSFNCWQVSVDGFSINSLIYSFSLDSFLHGLEWNFTGGFFFILRF